VLEVYSPVVEEVPAYPASPESATEENTLDVPPKGNNLVHDAPKFEEV
jgi:hypothetical protein